MVDRNCIVSMPLADPYIMLYIVTFVTYRLILDLMIRFLDLLTPFGTTGN
jgi:hypothetical protein